MRATGFPNLVRAGQVTSREAVVIRVAVAEVAVVEVAIVRAAEVEVVVVIFGAAILGNGTWVFARGFAYERVRGRLVHT